MDSRRRLLRLRHYDRRSLPALRADCDALYQKMICEFARHTGDAGVMPGLVPEAFPQVMSRVVGRVAPAAAHVVVRHGSDRVIDFLTCRVWIAFEAVARQRDVPSQVVMSEHLGRLFNQLDELRDIVARQLRLRHRPRIHDAPQQRDLLFSLLALRVAAATELAGTTAAAAAPGASAASAGCPDPLGAVRAVLEHEPQRSAGPNGSAGRSASGSTDGGLRVAEVARGGERPGAAGSAEFWAAAEKDLMAGIDSSRPNSARVWNHWLGDKDNYPVDRGAADAFAEAFPQIVDIALQSRYFLHRAVGYLAGEAGIGQFLDLGCGLPTVDNTHEVAQRVAPDARVVYADRDRLVMSHARALLTGGPQGGCGYVEADICEPEQVLAGAAADLDLTRPVAVLMVHVLGHIDDDRQAQSIIARLMEALPAGSHLVICDQTGGAGGTGGTGGAGGVHPSTPPACGPGRAAGAIDAAGGVRQSSSGPAEDVDAGGQVPAGLGAGGGSGWSPHAQAVGRYNETAAEPLHLRSPARIARFFDGLTLLAPGVVSCTRWRPELALHAPEVEAFGGVGRT